jgi:hypothetical protein
MKKVLTWGSESYTVDLSQSVTTGERAMEKMSEQYEALTEDEVREWRRIQAQAEMEAIEKRAAEYLANRKQ